MKSQIFFVIPREEEKYKDCYKYGGKIWHNKLWFRRKKFSEIFKHYKELVENQRTKYQETSQVNKDFLKKLFEELKEAVDGVGKKDRIEKELWSKLTEKLREIKRLKEELKKIPKKPAETEKPKEKKKPKEEIDNEEIRKKLAELKETKKIIKEKLTRFEKPEEDLLNKKKSLEEELTEKVAEARKIEKINELEEEWKKLDKEYINSKKTYSTFNGEIDPQKMGQMNWFLENFSFRNYKYTYLKWIEKDPDSWRVKDDAYSDWEEREKLLDKHDIKFCGEGLTREKITFNYRIPDNIIIKLYNFLLYYNGVWYEVSDHKQVEWDRVEVTANYSYYWNDYWYCLNANANGIIHNLPVPLHEVCACPDFTQEEVKVKNIFVITNYELKWDLWRAYGHARKESNWYLLWLNGKEGKTSRSNNLNFPWIKLGAWKKVDWHAEEGRDFVWYLFGENSAEEDVAKGKNEQLFSLVSQRAKETNETSDEHFMNLEAWTDVNIKVKGGKVEMTKGGDAKEFADWINTEYLPELHHCRANHIEASIKWRDKTVWKGNLNEIQDKDKNTKKERLYLSMIETSNASGTVVTFYDKYGNTIAQVHESIFIKIGKADENNVILNTIISTAAAAAIGAATGGAGAVAAGKAVGAAVGAGAVKGAAAGGIGAFAGGVKGRLMNQGETIREEFTIDEFQHKFLRSGHNPVKIVLEHDKEVINRYWANKTIKKGGESNTYFNAASFGGLMDKEGFVKFHFHTLNMHSMVESEESKRWFKDNLQSGVQLIDGDPVPWYQTKLPESKLKSTGANVSGDIDTLEVSGGKKPLGTADFSDNKYSNTDYIGSANSALWSQMKPQLNGSHHEGSSPIPNCCLGCLTGGGHKNNPTYNWKSEVNLTVGGTFELKTHGSGVQTFTVPSGGGKLIIECMGTGQAEIYMEEVKKVEKSSTSGEPPEGWGAPPSAWVPNGGGLVPEASEPNMEPEINPPEAIVEPTEALIDGTELQVEPEEEPEDPEPEGEPEEEPEDPEPEPEETPEDTPEVEVEEEDEDEAWSK